MGQHSQAKLQFGKFIRTIFPALAILLAGVLIVLVLLVYRVTHPETAGESVDPSFHLLPALDVTIPAADAKDIHAWWIPGLRGAPGIILAPGYGMNRADALSLAVCLRAKGFNLLIYDQRGSSVFPRGASTMGLHEADDMASVLNFLRNRPESNPSSIGIWGVDVGAHAALKVAASAPEIRAIAADSAFEFPSDFLDYRIYEDFGLSSNIIKFGCRQMFELLYARQGFSLRQPLSIEALSDRAILFIRGENRGQLARLTAALYERIHPQKEMITLKAARSHLMVGEELRDYDRRITSFFQSNLR